jgi:hypothetical protein
MVTQQQQQESPVTSEVAVVGGWPRLVVAPVALVLGALSVYLIGLDSFWPVLVGAVAAAALAVLVDFGLSRAAGRIGRHMKVTQLAVAVALALGVGLFYRMERTDAFERAFGMAPPAGVSHVDIEHLVAKETGRKLTMMQFEASRATLDLLVGGRRFVQDAKVSVKHGKEAKVQRSLWGRAFRDYGLVVEDRWKTRLPVTEPMIYTWYGKEKETLGQQATVLWDAASGRGCVIHESQ